MRTKITAAQRAARSGAVTLIASGAEDDILLKIARNETLGTLLTADSSPLATRKQWLANQLSVQGSLQLDAGACSALKKNSLLAVGVNKVSGTFQRGDVVSCLDTDGNEIARGLVNYKTSEVELIKGKTSDEIESLLGYIDEPELIHRDNLVLL